MAQQSLSPLQLSGAAVAGVSASSSARGAAAGGAANATQASASARAKFPSPYHVSTYGLSFNSGPKHHFVTTHWTQERAAPAAAAGAGAAAAPAADAGAYAAPEPDALSSSAAGASAAAAGAGAAAALSTSGSRGGSAGGAAYGAVSDKLKATLPAPTPLPAAPTVTRAEAAAKDGWTPGSTATAGQVYASGEGVQQIGGWARSAGKFHSAKRVYRPAASTVAATAERLNAETEEYRARGLKYGSSIANIAFHQPHVEMKLPGRFESPEVFERPRRQQHPAYRTTSNQIGFRPPNQEELNKVYATRPISFTAAFTSGPYRSGGLNTAIAKPRVDTKEGLNLG